VGTHLLQEQRGSFGGAAGGQEIIDEQHPIAWFHRVGMDGNGGAAVFQFVALFVRFEGELALLTHRHEPGLQLQSRRRGEDKPARIDPDYEIDLVRLKAIHQQPDGSRE
jgi:hypothetical protein